MPFRNFRKSKMAPKIDQWRQDRHQDHQQRSPGATWEKHENNKLVCRKRMVWGSLLRLAITAVPQQDTVDEASTCAGAAAEAYERYKRNSLNTKVDCRAQGVAFVPMVVEPSGGLGFSAMCTIKRLARAAAIRSDSQYAPVFASHLASLCSVIRCSNAQALLRRLPEGTYRLTESAISAIAAASLDSNA